MATMFTKVYNRFLGKITDDMYIELTPEDTIRDLQNLLIDAIPNFEFPRQNLFDYEIKTVQKREDTLTEDDFVLGVVWAKSQMIIPKYLMLLSSNRHFQQI